jgi:Na+/H+ antiporter NhaC
MAENHKIRTSAIAIGVFVSACSLAYASSIVKPGVAPWYSVVPPLAAVLIAISTRRLYFSLASSVVMGGVLSVVRSGWGDGSFLQTTGVLFVRDSLADRDYQLILLYVVLIMAMIAVMLRSGGLRGIANGLSRFAKGPRSAKLVTAAAGLIIFIDDYANTMIVGSAMRPITDRCGVSREKLAFLVDATAAPIAGIALVSTWIGYEISLLGDQAVELGIDHSAYSIFLDAIAYRFYCIVMIAFVFLNSLFDVDFGPMAKAEEAARRAAPPKKLNRTQGIDKKKTQTKEEDATPDDIEPRASTALLPMFLLLTIFLGGMFIYGGGELLVKEDSAAFFKLATWRTIFSEANSIPVLAIASAAGFYASLLMARGISRASLNSLASAVLQGLRTALTPVVILSLAWSLKAVCSSDYLGTGDFLAAALGDSITPMIYPCAVFIIAGLTAFATGTSWGAMAILIPTAVPVAFQLDGSVYGPITIITIAAILDGAIFGDHCSPISDTTIMSSTASGCDHIAHVRTQMPYAVFVGLVVLSVAYPTAAAGWSPWFGITTSVALCTILFLVIRIMRKSDARNF